MIDKELQKQLRMRFNSDGSMLRQQQLRMLGILLYVDKVCKENNINYWLSSGTLLGAVRHGGFIPWDDDLDIEMLRDDYVKFLRIFPKNDNYALQTNCNDPHYFHNYSKVRDLHSSIDEFGQDRYYRYRGLFVDVFCIERLPLSVCKFYGRVFGLIQRLGIKGAVNKMLWIAIKFIQKVSLLSIHIIRPICKILATEYHHSYGAVFFKERYIEDIFPLTNINFEGYLFPAPNNADHYLKTIYGDYTKLPELDKIVIHTSSCIFKS